ncbi:MAG TPA: dTDP-4-dehydrorhamnose reductase [Polyangiaceae bacterium]
MKVWLTGENGLLGSALRDRLRSLRISHTATGRELDVADAARVLEFARNERPTHIVNAAAYTKVDDAESHESEALRTNAFGPEHLARAAAELGAQFAHFSTDYVFSGAACEPYVESAATGPTGAYGRTKLAGEERVLAVPGAQQLAYVIRTSWLFGDHGPSFPKTIARACLEKDELRVVADQRGRPTYAGDLADATLELLGVGSAGTPAAAGVYHFANAGETTWHGLAEAVRETLLRLGKPVKAKRIVAVTTAEYPRPAARPSYSVLDTQKLEAALGRAPRHHREPLAEFLARLAL